MLMMTHTRLICYQSVQIGNSSAISYLLADIGLIFNANILKISYPNDTILFYPSY